MLRIDLSIVIVSWNVKQLLIDCIKSIQKSAAKGLAIETIIVDNDSSDGSVEALRMLFPDVVLIENKINAGFPAANNQGIALARGRHILLLNPDTVIIGDALQKMVRFADEHPEIGLLGPRLCSPDGSIQDVCARSFPSPLNWFWYYSFMVKLFPRSPRFGEYKLSYWDHLDNRPVNAIVGAAILIPRKVLQDIGPLDESHPMYLEDLDYCYRVHRSGRTVYYLADAVIIHYGGQSSSKVSTKAWLLSLEAHRLFFIRYGAPGDTNTFLAAVAIAALIRLPVFVLLRLWARLFGRSFSWVSGIDLKREMVGLLYGMGALKPPRIETVSIKNP